MGTEVNEPKKYIGAYKKYLGDGAYIRYHPHENIEITTEDGVSTTNSIWLGPTEIRLLVDFVKEKGLLLNEKNPA